MAMTNEKLLEVNDLCVTYRIGKKSLEAVKGVSFHLRPGFCLGIVGESGSGKSTIAASVLGILPRELAKVNGEVLWGDEDLLRLSRARLNALRGAEISMIFQNPSQALHPMYTIEFQLEQVFDKVSSSNFSKGTLSVSEAMSMARLKCSKDILSTYPHELSGGMKQRVMLAMALMGKPQLIVADEPTSALDVTVQLEVIELLRSIIANENVSLLLISHNLGVVAGIADEIVVLRNGGIVESGTAEQILLEPQHTYTRELVGIRV